MKTTPRLLYHNPSAIPYPTNTSNTLLTIRFPTALRISSIRISPEGVSSFTGPGYVAFLCYVADEQINLSRRMDRQGFPQSVSIVPSQCARFDRDSGGVGGT